MPGHLILLPEMQVYTSMRVLKIFTLSSPIQTLWGCLIIHVRERRDCHRVNINYPLPELLQGYILTTLHNFLGVGPLGSLDHIRCILGLGLYILGLGIFILGIAQERRAKLILPPRHLTGTVHVFLFNLIIYLTGVGIVITNW